MSQIEHVPFHGSVIHTTLVDGEPAVVLRPTLEGMGLNSGAQLDKLKTRSWAVVRQTPTTGADGKTYLMATVNLDTWAMLLANIDERRVSKAARSLVVRYQTESARVLREYWTTGKVVGHRITPGDFFEPTTLSYDEVCALLRQRYGMSFSVVQLTRMLRTAGVLKVNGAPKKRFTHWFWFTDSAWNIHPHVIPEVAGRLVEKTREIQEFRFIQARLELEGVGEDPFTQKPRLTP